MITQIIGACPEHCVHCAAGQSRRTAYAVHHHDLDILAEAVGDLRKDGGAETDEMKVVLDDPNHPVILPEW